MFIRGGESRHAALYIDGLRVDSQTTGGAAWEMLPVAEIERIEVLRGPAAAVYGSDAIAGVVQLFTKRGAGALQANAAVSVGSFATRQASAGVNGVAGAVDYALSGSAGRSQGFNARPGSASANPDDDGWRRGSLQGRLGWQLAAGHRVEAAVLASNLRAQYDGSLKNDDIARNALRTVSLGWQGQWNKDSNTHVQIGQSQATYETQPSYYRTETTLRNYLLQQGQTWGNQHLDLTVERREDELLNPATAFAAELRGQRHQDALGLGWRIDLGEHALQAFVRHD
ncbi:MAG: TonB-dependent receptor, partial [Burkholderiales bacterium PBB5]